ncbi:UbiA family prenyltransferase [Rickettsiella endosymbiont of Xylota segnis]|uniref:UbiA family prenyltransferase n=1 Tax=Rickettsiella endosymbiont of Xylota segnis TaxID=3066238 RepID=UPI0030D1DDC6
MLNKKNKIKIKACFKAVRPYHAIKNILLFIPLFVGHQYFNTNAIKNSFLGFFIFCLLASSAYLINDLVDLENDKQHLKKQKRPFASGQLSHKIGYILAPLLAIVALSLAILLPLNFLIIAIAYYCLTLLYTFFIKQIKWLDAILLAFLYSVRVFAGMTLIENGFSFWLIFFVLSLFFSLALLKRYAELTTLQIRNKLSILGRAYKIKDKIKLALLGYISGYASVLVFIFYIYSAKAHLFYRTPLLLWVVCPCLFIWLNHMWQFAQEGKIDDDPVIFTIKNRCSWAFLACIVTISVLATEFKLPFNSF